LNRKNERERERERKEVQDGLRTSAKQDKRYDWLREMRTLVGEKESDRKRERERDTRHRGLLTL